MLCDPCLSLFASFMAQRYKKNLTYTRIPPRKTPRELIFHPEATQKIGKVRQNGCKFIGKVRIRGVKIVGKVCLKCYNALLNRTLVAFHRKMVL